MTARSLAVNHSSLIQHHSFTFSHHLAQKTHPSNHSDLYPFPNYSATDVLGTQNKSKASLEGRNLVPESLTYSSPRRRAGEDRRRGREMSLLGYKTNCWNRGRKREGRLTGDGRGLEKND